MSEDLEYKHYPAFSGKTKLFSWATSGEVVNLLDLSYEYITSLREKIIKQYGKDTYINVLRGSIWSSKSLLSFDDFYRYRDIKNNFINFFSNTLVYGFDIYQSRPIYKRFSRENPELNKKILEIFNEKIFSHKIKYQAKLLYQAYCIMHSYDEVQTNHDLFA